MLLKTYEKILELFHQNHGYMNFEQLKDHGITAIQIQELVDKEVLEKFARGWYWCTECGREKPVRMSNHSAASSRLRGLRSV